VSVIDEILHKNGSPEEDMELDLAPLLGLMAALIPVLLMASAFVKLSSLNAKVPVLGEAQAAIDKNVKDNQEKKIGLYIEVNGESIVLLNMKQGDKILQTARVPASAENKVDEDAFVDAVVKMKLSHPEVFRARLNPTEKVKYESIVGLIDNMRVSPNNEEFPVVDKESGKTFKTPIMYDDVTFGNIMGEDE
jgi:biopolymer transport protein ExbD